MRVVMAALLLLGLGGCLEPDSSAVVTLSPQDGLSSYQACHYRYDDGIEIPCDLDHLSTMDFLAVQSQAPFDWWCRDQLQLADGRGIDVMAPAVTPSVVTHNGVAGIRFASGAIEGPVGGLAIVQRGGRPSLSSWLSPSATGFVQFDGSVDVPLDNLTVRLYTVSIDDAAPTRLADAALAPLWSIHNGRLYAIYVVSTHGSDTRNPEVWFFQAPSVPLGETPRPVMTVEGADFHATLVVRETFSGGTGSANAVTPLPCV